MGGANKAALQARKDKGRLSSEAALGERRQQREEEEAANAPMPGPSKSASDRVIEDEHRQNVKALNSYLQTEYKKVRQSRLRVTQALIGVARISKVARLESQLTKSAEEVQRLKLELAESNSALATNATAALAFDSLDLPQARSALASSEEKMKQLKESVKTANEKVILSEANSKAANEENDILRTRLGQVQNELENNEGEKKAKAEVERLKEVVATKDGEIAKLETDRTKNQGKLKIGFDKFKALEAKQAQLVKDKDELSKSRKVLEDRLSAAQKTSPQSNGSSAASVAATNLLMAEIQRDLSEAHERIDELEGELMASERKLKLAEAGKLIPSQSSTSAATDKKKISTLEKSLATAKKDLASAQKDLDTARTNPTLNAAQQNELDALRDRVANEQKRTEQGTSAFIALVEDMVERLDKGDFSANSFRLFLERKNKYPTSAEQASLVSLLDESCRSLAAFVKKLKSRMEVEVQKAQKKVGEVEKERTQLQIKLKEVEERLGRKINELESKVAEFESVVSPRSSPSSVTGFTSASGGGNLAAVEILAKDVVRLSQTITELREENLNLLLQVAGLHS
ncbi:hypothetical protein P7C70_g1907, partial [Phenoliferia sp. Uapishka_3]